jgi:hypothetical protein
MEVRRDFQSRDAAHDHVSLEELVIAVTLHAIGVVRA